MLRTTEEHLYMSQLKHISYGTVIMTATQANEKSFWALCISHMLRVLQKSSDIWGTNIALG
jgi:hypothetical protein